MPVDIVMPRLSDTMTEGTIARWLKQPGDAVKKGEALAQIETDKALMDYESFEEGTLGEIKVGDGQTVPLGEVIAVLYKAGESAPAGAEKASSGGATAAPTSQAAPAASDAPGVASGPAERGTSAAPKGEAESAGAPAAAPARRDARAEDAATPADARPAAGRDDGGGAATGARGGGGSEALAQRPPSQGAVGQNGSAGRVRASPLARRLAAEHGVDLSRVHGTGPGGRVVRADVEDAAAAARAQARSAPAAQAAAPAAPAGQPAGDADRPADEARRAAAAGEFKSFTRMQAVIARRMVESKTQVPHIYLTTSIDMAAAMRFRAESNEHLGKERGLSVNDLFLKALALTLRKHPDVNASYRDNGIQYNADVNIGFAVSLPQGLVVPVIRNVDQKPLPQIAAEARALAEKARTTGLAIGDYEGGTFSTSNLGMLGVEEFDAVVNPPQAAILAIGAVVDEPVVKDGQVVPGKRCKVTLSCDQRVVYGWTAGEFLRDLKALLERPFGLVY